MTAQHSSNNTTGPEANFEATGVHLIPGFDPTEADRFDVQFNCRPCLTRRMGVVMTMSKCSELADLETVAQMPCPMGENHTVPNEIGWNVEYGWVGRWDSDDDDPEWDGEEGEYE